MFVQIHMLQSIPPGNLNRDDTGQPKKCTFGGVTRGRISSQCLKRNIRRSAQFKEAFGKGLADRTQYLPRMVADSGITVRPGDPHALAAAWGRILDASDEERRARGEAARRRVMRHYSLSEMVDRYAATYRRLLDAS